jgi:hypothetical protein
MSPIEKLATALEIAGELISRQKQAAAKQAAAVKAASDKIPQVVRVLVNTGKMPESDSEKMAAALVDPSKALDVLANTARFKDTSLGQEIPSGSQKSASVRSPIVGAPGSDSDRYKPFGASRR